MKQILVLLSIIRYFALGAPLIHGLNFSVGGLFGGTDEDVSSVGPGIGGAPILVRNDGLPSSLARSGGLIQVASPDDFKSAGFLRQKANDKESPWKMIVDVLRHLRLVAEDEMLRRKQLYGETVRIRVPEETKISIKLKEDEEKEHLLPIIRPATNINGKITMRKGEIDEELPVIRPATNVPKDHLEDVPIKRSKERTSEVLQYIKALRLKEMMKTGKL